MTVVVDSVLPVVVLSVLALVGVVPAHKQGKLKILGILQRGLQTWINYQLSSRKNSMQWSLIYFAIWLHLLLFTQVSFIEL